MLRSDLIVLNSKETAKTNQQRELLDLIEGGSFGWDKVCEMGQLITREHPGRTSEQQIIYYKSNTGVGIQFAAAGARPTSLQVGAPWQSCPPNGSALTWANEWTDDRKPFAGQEKSVGGGILSFKDEQEFLVIFTGVIA